MGACPWWRASENDCRLSWPGMTSIGELRHADLAEERGDLIAELLALRLQRLGGLLDVLGGCRVGIGLHAGDVVGRGDRIREVIEWKAA